MKSEKILSIKYVSEASGLSPHLIRKWEERYNIVTPGRSETNRRAYSRDDLNKLKLIKEAKELGHSLIHLSDLSESELKEIVATGIVDGKVSTQTDLPEEGFHLENCFRAAVSTDTDDLEIALNRASLALDTDSLITGVIKPLMHRIGNMWSDGEIQIYMEHRISSVIRTFLGNYIQSKNIRTDAPVVVITTPAGQYHEFGALTTAVGAVIEGWKPEYLGPNLPAEEISSAVNEVGADLLALSITISDDSGNLFYELKKTRDLTPKDIPILIGGSAAGSILSDQNDIGIEFVKEFQAFRRLLKSFSMN